MHKNSCQSPWLVNQFALDTIWANNLLTTARESEPSQLALLNFAIKANYFKKECFLSSFLLTWSKYTGPKWSWSTQQASTMSEMHETSLLSTPWSFWICSLLQVSKNDDKNVACWNNLALPETKGKTDQMFPITGPQSFTFPPPNRIFLTCST